MRSRVALFAVIHALLAPVSAQSSINCFDGGDRGQGGFTVANARDACSNVANDFTADTWKIVGGSGNVQVLVTTGDGGCSFTGMHGFCLDIVNQCTNEAAQSGVFPQKITGTFAGGCPHWSMQISNIPT